MLWLIFSRCDLTAELSKIPLQVDFIEIQAFFYSFSPIGGILSYYMVYVINILIIVDSK